MSKSNQNSSSTTSSPDRELVPTGIPRPRTTSLVTTPRRYYTGSSSEKNEESPPTPLSASTPLQAKTPSKQTKTEASPKTPTDLTANKVPPRTSSSLGHTPSSQKTTVPRPATSLAQVRKTNNLSLRPTQSSVSLLNASVPAPTKSGGATKPAPLLPSKKSDTLKVKLTTSTKPLKIEESAMAKEFQAIQAVLLSKNQEDWAERNKALLKLESIILGGATEFPSFLKEFDNLKRPLIYMISDLRSILVKQGCVILCLISKKLGTSFSKMAPAFIQELMKQTVVSVRVIADATDICIKTILKFSHPQMLKDIFEGLKDKNNVLLRQRCIGYVTVILTEYTPQELEKLKAPLIETIKAALSDASSEVRTESRICFHLFSNHFPEDAKKIFDNLDSVVQKYLQKDVPKNLSGAEGQESSQSNTQNSLDSSQNEPLDVSSQFVEKSEEQVTQLDQNSDTLAESEEQRFDLTEESEHLEQLKKDASLPTLDEETPQAADDEMY